MAKTEQDTVPFPTLTKVANSLGIRRNVFISLLIKKGIIAKEGKTIKSLNPEYCFNSAKYGRTRIVFNPAMIKTLGIDALGKDKRYCTQCLELKRMSSFRGWRGMCRKCEAEKALENKYKHQECVEDIDSYYLHRGLKK